MGPSARVLSVLLAASIASTITSALPQPRWNDEWLNLTVIHTNDVHSRVDPANSVGVSCNSEDIAAGHCYGGTARHKTVIDGLRNANKHSLLLDGGDEVRFQGTLFYTYYRGTVTAEVLNELGYDLATIGNHEWDDGPENLGRYWARTKYPIICANVDLSKYPHLAKFVKPYHIFEDIGVAVIGYITGTTGDISNAGPNVIFSDPIPAVQKYVDILEAKGIKRILTLSHNGYKDDMQLAAATHGIDLIVGGHSHSYLGDKSNPLSEGPYPTIIKNLKGENTLIVQAFCWGRYIGHLDVVFNPDGKIESWKGEPILVEHSIPGDPRLLGKIDGWRGEFEEWGKTVVGVATDVFVQGTCKQRECSMGNMVADAMLAMARTQSQTRNRDSSNPYPELAFINSGGIRSGLPVGNVTVEMIMTTSPFGNRMVQTLMEGKEILTMLEAIAVGHYEGSPKPVTSNVQISGMRYSFDSSRLAGKQRLIKAEVQVGQGWQVIDPTKLYWVVTLDFVLKGGDNILVPRGGRLEIPMEQLDRILIDYIKTEGSISPYLDGRIKNVAAGAGAADMDMDCQTPAIWPPSTPEHIKSQYPGGFEEMLKDYERLRNANFGVQEDEPEENSVFGNRDTQQDVLG
ncbi:hypothetical protein BGX34_000638 [Mortierella sp. NVP85]|nr:hypothetical protein BGX34_000638 [Mortierella sp. NVP85]